MSKTLIGVIIIVVIIIVGILLYLNAKNNAAKLEQQKLAALNSGLTNALTYSNQPGFFQSLLNSQSVSALFGGFGQGLGSNYGQGGGMNTGVQTQP